MAVVIWSLTRLYRGVWGAFDSYFFEVFLVSLVHIESESMTAPVLTILLFVFTEILPIMFVQDWAFMEIFVLRPE